MAKSQDLTPKFATLPSAAQSLYTPTASGSDTSQSTGMATTTGGLQANPTQLTRGSGNAVFGVDTNGLWMGAADFADAPWTVDYFGNETIKSSDLTGISFFNAKVLAFSDDVGNWSIIIGDPTALPSL